MGLQLTSIISSLEMYKDSFHQIMSQNHSQICTHKPKIHLASAAQYSFILSNFHSFHSKGTCGLKGHFNLITLESKCYRTEMDQYRG